MKEDIKNLTLPKLEGFLQALGQPRFRAAQIYGWLHKGAVSFEEMGNLPKALKTLLEERSYICAAKILTVQQSAEDGTRKYLLGFEDGNAIESVFMRYKYGNTACISSQAGCRMGCKFCASTLKGLARNLTGGEMLEQILAMERDTGEKIGHVVIMGSGEPLDNYDNLCRFLDLVHEPKGLNLGLRNITVSTCGLIPEMERFRKEYPQVNLALSLHAPNQKVREQLMPIAKRYSFGDLINCCREHGRETGRRVTFEYALAAGVNDGLAQADELAGRLGGLLCHVNLIPLNPVEERGMDGTARDKAEQFKNRLEAKGIPCTLRRRLGADIDAACGQLRLKAASEKRETV